MMDYEVFKDVVKEKFLSYMPEKYQGMKLRISPIEKVNRTLDGINLWQKGVENPVSPTIYVNDMYEEYVETGDLQAVLQGAAETMDGVFQLTPQSLPLDVRTAKEKIIFQLVNTRQNEDMLRSLPHREFQDLSIIYRWVLGENESRIYSTVINNSLADRLGLKERELFQAAAGNTWRILPPVVKSMSEIMMGMFLSDGMPQEMAEIMIGEIPPEREMWVISNNRGVEGAASMLYEEALHSLAEKIGSDLYILPSSIHEVIAVSVDIGEPEELARIVTEINMDQVKLEERLSNQVYHYDKDLRDLTLATNTPHKRLDGGITAPPLIYEEKQSR